MAQRGAVVADRVGLVALGLVERGQNRVGASSLREGLRLQYYWTRAEDLTLMFSFDVEQDGSFRLPLVPAGTGKLYEGGEGATLSREVQVTEGANTWVDL